MKLVTLQCRAPVAPGATHCQLCDVSIEGTFQDHLLVGQPGTPEHTAVICAPCGETLRRFGRLCGPELSLLVPEAPEADSLAAATRARSAAVLPPAPDPRVEQARQHLTQEADNLSRTERSLRAEAERLADAPKGR
jgi:hypothetical protein